MIVFRGTDARKKKRKEKEKRKSEIKCTTDEQK